MVQQGCKANIVLDTLKGMIDSIIKSVVFYWLLTDFLERNI
jgi:hypothetical protein